YGRTNHHYKAQSIHSFFTFGTMHYLGGKCSTSLCSFDDDPRRVTSIFFGMLDNRLECSPCVNCGRWMFVLGANPIVYIKYHGIKSSRQVQRLVLHPGLQRDNKTPGVKIDNDRKIIAV